MLHWLVSADTWTVFPISATAIFLATVGGQMLGRAVRAKQGENAAAHLAPLQGALIGLLSLMIGFTFSLSAARYEARKAATLNESSAISTTFERAHLLPQPHAERAERLLAAYLGLRIATGEGGRPPSPDAARRASLQVDRVETALWREASAVTMAEPASQIAGLFVAALNEMGDRKAERTAANLNQVPDAVFLLLYALALAAWGFTGYAAGRDDGRNLVSNLLLSLAFATVIALVADMDQPGSGLVTVGQGPLTDLEADLARR